ncbi:MAG: PVC-type heme-binding CxxCH protein [Bacteroidota bacterium]
MDRLLNSAIGIICLLLGACTQGPQTQTLSSEQLNQQSSELIPQFEWAEGFELELFAIEPLVSDPVAMEITEEGRMFVVEMHGYPLDVSGTGVIRELIDTDGDGYPNKSEVFADKLTLPTGIMRWKKGFLVPDAPDLVYLEDSDGDGKADKREVILTGFARSNPQHNFNTPLYGLDNYIYLANEYFITTRDYADIFGDEGSEIFFPAHPEGPRLPANANDQSVRFHPDKQELYMTSSNTQYGHTFDPWGRYFQTSNASHLYHEVIDASYLERKPELLVADAQQYVPTYGHPIEVFPITQNPQHQLLTDIGTITSACAITWYQGGSFPESFNDVVFTAEPTHNLVHADKVMPNGATFSSTPLSPEKAFLASKDPTFRPVSLYTGPDGAMYVLDYHRQIIEHPEWMAESVNQSGELYEGNTQGRIYRIYPKGASPSKSSTPLASQTPEEWVDHLSHKNLWWRKNAQRLLVNRKDVSVKALLEAKARDDQDGLGQLHALWTLQGLNSLEPTLIRKALASPTAGVRENALKLLEASGEKLEVWMTDLAPLAEDPDSRVRFQLLCTLGSVEEAQQLVQNMLFEDIADPWTSLAAFSSPMLKPANLFAQGVDLLGEKEVPGAEAFFGTLGSALVLSEGEEERKDILQQVLAPGNAYWKAPLLSGMHKVLRYQAGEFSLDEESYTALLATALGESNPMRDEARKLLSIMETPEGVELSKVLTQAETIAREHTYPDARRADAVALLAIVLPDSYDDTFISNLQFQVPQPLQVAAVEGLGQLSENRGCSHMLSQWAHLTPEVRSLAVDQFMGEPDRMRMLLSAIKEGVVQSAALGWPRTVRLMNNDYPEIKQYAREILAPEEENQEEVLARYEEVLYEGQASQGLSVYQQQCAVCHTYKGKGNIAYGPDLASLRNRLASSLLHDILYPNRAIADGYEVWSAKTQAGKEWIGIISKETASTITLRSADGSEQTLSRDQIEELTVLPYSGMPAGLGEAISPREMADLIAFIKEGDASLLASN